MRPACAAQAARRLRMAVRSPSRGWRREIALPTSFDHCEAKSASPDFDYEGCVLEARNATQVRRGRLCGCGARRGQATLYNKTSTTNCLLTCRALHCCAMQPNGPVPGVPPSRQDSYSFPDITLDFGLAEGAPSDIELYVIGWPRRISLEMQVGRPPGGGGQGGQPPCPIRVAGGPSTAAWTPGALLVAQCSAVFGPLADHLPCVLDQHAASPPAPACRCSRRWRQRTRCPRMSQTQTPRRRCTSPSPT